MTDPARRASRTARCAASALLVALLFTVGAGAAVRGVQTFPDPFGGEGTFVDIRAGADARDVGDAFFLRDGPILRIRLFLDAPNTLVESHVCLSAEAFTERLPPGQCQAQAFGTTAATYDLGLPPAEFPAGTVPFADPLGAFCTQVHVSYSAPGLAVTSGGGGSAYAGWKPGQPFFGNVCFAEVGPPEPPGPLVDVDKTGALDLDTGDVVFTVVATNTGGGTAEDVVVLDLLDPALPWSVPGGCTVVDNVAACPIGDLAPGASSAPLVFTGTPSPGFCGTVENRAGATVGASARRSSDAHTATVEIPCPPLPVDPLLLLSKVPAQEAVAVPGTVTWVVTLENAGPGDAVDVEFEDELPPGITWTLGSGENVCSIDGTLLTCAVPLVADGVFETLEIIGSVDQGSCGVLENRGTVTWSGGPADGSVTAISPPIEVVGCSTPPPTPGGDVGAGGETPGGAEGELPDTGSERNGPAAVVVLGFALVGSAMLLGRRRFVVR